MLLTRTVASLVSLALVLPFAAFELRQNGLHAERTPDYVVLFGLLWALPMAFLVTSTGILQSLRSGKGPRVAMGFKLTLLLFFAAAWMSIVNDQLPCFMGAVNCD